MYDSQDRPENREAGVDGCSLLKKPVGVPHTSLLVYEVERLR